MYIGVSDLAYFILFCLAIGVGMYLILTLRRLYLLTGQLSAVIRNNEVAIEETCQLLPGTLASVNEASAQVKENLAYTGAALDSLGSTLSGKVTSLGEGAENLIVAVRVLGELVATVVSHIRDSKNG